MRWLVGFGLGVLVPLLLNEFMDWCPWLSERLIRRAARRLPDADRARYQEEWLAELGEVPGKLAPLTMALGIVVRAGRMGRVLQGRLVLPGRAWVFVAAVAAAATIVVGVLVPAAMQELAGEWPGAALWPLAYAGLLVLGERLIMRVPLGSREVSVGMAEIVIVLGVVFLSAPLLVLATVLGIGVSQWLFESRPVKRLFNIPQYVLAVEATALACKALVGVLQGFIYLPGGGVSGPVLTVVWAAGMVVFFLVNHTLISVVVSLSTGQRLRQTWVQPAPGDAVDWAASTTYGLVIAALLVHDQALLPLLVIPIALTFLSARAWTAEDGSARSTVEVLAEELGPSPRWTATTTRTTRSKSQ
jgi:hypothetical protein